MPRSLKLQTSPGFLALGTTIFRPSKLIAAAQVHDIRRKAGVPIALIARKLSNGVIVALSQGCAFRDAPGHEQQLARLRTIQNAATSLLEALGLPPALHVSASIRRTPNEIVSMLLPGFRGLGRIPWATDLIALAGGQSVISERMAERATLCREFGMNMDEVASEESQTIERVIAEALLARVPIMAAALRELACSAAETLPRPRKGRREDYATLMVMRELCQAHKELFGKAPVLRNTEGERDTPSVRWVSEVMKSAVCRMRQATIPLPDRNSNYASPESQAFEAMANLGLGTINDWLADAKRENRPAA